MRDDFAVEIWQGLGVDDEPTVYAQSEFWIALLVTAINGSIIAIRNNRLAFLSSIGIISVGFLIVIGSLFGQSAKILSPMAFMILLGLGMYIPYVAFHTTIFERMIASFREIGTLGYLMYLADALGYLGYVAVMIFRNYASDQIDFLKLMIWTSTIVAVVSLVLTVFLAVYYHRRVPRESEPLVEVETA